VHELDLIRNAVMTSHPGAVLAPAEDGAWRGLSVTYDGGSFTAMMDPSWIALSRRLEGPSRPGAGDPRAALLASCREHMVKYSLFGEELVAEVELPRLAVDAAYLDRAVAALTRPGRAPAAGEGALEKSAQDALEPISKTDVFVYFRSVAHLGWAPKEPTRPDEWHASIAGVDRRYDLYLSLNRFWAHFQIPLLTDADLGANAAPAALEVLERHILETNPRLCWAKLGLDDEGQVLLQLDLPVECLDIHRFRFAAQTLSHYLHAVAYDVQILASLPRDEALGAFFPASAGARERGGA
jgi:hypothetical protein